MWGSPLNFRCQRSYPRMITGARRNSSFRAEEGAAEPGFEADHAEIVLCDRHSLHRLASVRPYQEIESPPVCGERGKRFSLFLPLHPLGRGPRLRACHWQAVGAGGLDKHEPLRLIIRGRRQQNTLDQAEHRRGRADTERQSQHGNQGEARLLPEHPRGKTQVLNHSSPPYGAGIGRPNFQRQQLATIERTRLSTSALTNLTLGRIVDAAHRRSCP